jgi:hypothetical protein
MILHLTVDVPYRPWSPTLEAEHTKSHSSVAAIDARESDEELYLCHFTMCSYSILS